MKIFDKFCRYLYEEKKNSVIDNLAYILPNYNSKSSAHDNINEALEKVNNDLEKSFRTVTPFFITFLFGAPLFFILTYLDININSLIIIPIISFFFLYYYLVILPSGDNYYNIKTISILLPVAYSIFFITINNDLSLFLGFLFTSIFVLLFMENNIRKYICNKYKKYFMVVFFIIIFIILTSLYLSLEIILITSYELLNNLEFTINDYLIFNLSPFKENIFSAYIITFIIGTIVFLHNTFLSFGKEVTDNLDIRKNTLPQANEKHYDAYGI